MEFKFFNASQAVNDAALKRSNSMGSHRDENQSPIEFGCIEQKPIKIMAGQRTQIIEVVGKLKNSYELLLEEEASELSSL